MYNRDYPERYALAGEQAIKNILCALKLVDKTIPDIKNILDFPSGHGRVLRYLKAKFEDAKIFACDIDTDMISFCKDVLGATPLESKENFNEISFNQKFDLIWCGSLFTHIDEKNWLALLNFFLNHLENGGILVFTVHGRKIINDVYSGSQNFKFDNSHISKLKEEYEKYGFGFLRRKEDKNYGISLSSPSFVIQTIQNIPSMKLLIYSEVGWLEHDIVAIQKDPKIKSIDG